VQSLLAVITADSHPVLERLGDSLADAFGGPVALFPS
jgi:hypothetical protein